jgi:hypothetical protein
MGPSHPAHYLLAAVLCCSLSVLCQAADNAEEPPEDDPGGIQLFIRLSRKDVFLYLSALEWGTPDNWSFTSRYLHLFNNDAENQSWLHHLTITLSPGTSGGRLGLGYQGIFVPQSLPDMAILSEARLVLMRTWGEPYGTVADRTFTGFELRTSFFGILLGLGYYIPLPAGAENQDAIWGFHVGLGI